MITDLCRPWLSRKRRSLERHRLAVSKLLLEDGSNGRCSDIQISITCPMFLFTRPLYGLAAHPAKWPFPPASSILLQTRSRLHSHSRILYPMTSRSPKVFTCVFKAIGLTSVSFGAFALVPIAHCDGKYPCASIYITCE